ncbi:FHA domain-containing protein [Singulisphaera sp. PoT]|uniref:FHA domain-containing protein n=1 Tax=Singulisphaera sp. PoT TaxID=3411797 RepID=UPI003BF495C5
MPARLVALEEGADIPLNQTMVVVGRHPQCDARLESLRVSRHHCCMTQDKGEVVVRDLGSTNGIRINGQRVESGRLRPGDELAIAHIRYRFESGQSHEVTLIDDNTEDRSSDAKSSSQLIGANLINGDFSISGSASSDGENPLAAAVREMLPAGVASKCRIKVIVQLPEEEDESEKLDACRPNSSP